MLCYVAYVCKNRCIYTYIYIYMYTHIHICHICIYACVPIPSFKMKIEEREGPMRRFRDT